MRVLAVLAQRGPDPQPGAGAVPVAEPLVIGEPRVAARRGLEFAAHLGHDGQGQLDLRGPARDVQLAVERQRAAVGAHGGLGASQLALVAVRVAEQDQGPGVQVQAPGIQLSGREPGQPPPGEHGRGGEVLPGQRDDGPLEVVRPCLEVPGRRGLP